ncbi:MAG TPA: zinc-dependent alcohol dehydrogenase [Candidatus Acidoferrales bacterium]|nr:zinc-dependent alcohol dehydrogenase [Candidatus Acidoferrales bacterium]
MKAAVLHEFGRPLRFEEVKSPTPEAEEVVIAVEACGLCHSDVHVADGDWTQLAKIVKKPVILGHEIVGRVVEKGPAAPNLQVGDRVGVAWLHWSCGECEFCREGNENLCARQKITGVTVDGGFAEFAKAPASHAIPIPSGLSAMEAAPLFCAGVTVYRALKSAKLSRGQRLAIFGIGGLGHIAVQMGRALGVDTIAVDVSEAKLTLAQSLGASRTFHAGSEDVKKGLRDIGGVHVAMVTSGAKAAYDAAFSCVRPSGALLIVGLPAEDISFAPILLAAREIRMQASAVGTRQDLRETLSMASEGKVHCHVSARPLAEANEAIDQLRRGQVTGRTVLTPR